MNKYKYRDRYKLGYHYIEEFSSEKQKWICLYVSYSSMDAYMWLKNHRIDADFVVDYNQFNADHGYDPWGGGVWLRSDPKKGECTL